jgi:L-idonate 5-dehydrogenase
MIAYVLHGKRDLRAEERPDPVAAPGEVLIQVRRMGICGSDVHYFATGHCGAFMPRRPFVLGHELAGQIVETGSGVSGMAVGERVAVDPSRPCGDCKTCLAGRSNLCRDMRYLGSASTDPHVDGAFSSYVAIPAGNCYPLPDNVDYAEATMLEPLSVATHAVKRAGSLAGKSVLVLGAGTVGQLVLLVARAMGAASIAVTDVRQEALDLAAAQGADHVSVATSAREELIAAYPSGFDVAIEASGAPEALRLALELSDRGGTIVQLGTLPAEVELPAHLIMQKELQVAGSFRFAHVFSQALQLIATRRVDVRPVITHTFGFGELVRAFDVALEDKAAFKIQVEN